MQPFVIMVIRVPVYLTNAFGVSEVSVKEPMKCRHFGIRASGSDRKENLLTKALIDAGEDIYIGEKKTLPEGTSLVVYSHAVQRSHPERVYARANGIIEVDRAQYLGALMQCYVFKIGVSGSHGKSTVTAMISKQVNDMIFDQRPHFLPAYCRKSRSNLFSIFNLLIS